MSKLSTFFTKLSKINRRKFIQYGSIAVGASILSSCTNDNQPASNSNQPSPTTNSSPSTAPAGKLDKVSYGTNWFAQAEHGGFYQAVATGIYQQYGLDVTIQMGGPQINGTQLLMGGAVDFFMGSGSDALKAIEEGIPKVTVAAIFQKDPAILMAHPGAGNDSLEKLKGKPIFISAASNVTFWPLLASKYGYTDDQKRPYNFNIGPFIADKNTVQQGYLTSEPFKVEKEANIKPVVILLADYGYSPYATTIETTKKLVETNPDLVQRFVDASIKGWYSYLENPTPANELIKKDNPQMTDDLLAYSLQKLKEYGIILSGDAQNLGIGTMNDERWKSFFETLVTTKVLKPDTKYQEAFTLQFVNKKSAKVSNT